MHLEAQERRSGPRNGPQAERLPGWGRSYLAPAPWYLVVARERKSRKIVVRASLGRFSSRQKNNKVAVDTPASIRL